MHIKPDLNNLLLIIKYFSLSVEMKLYFWVVFGLSFLFLFLKALEIPIYWINLDSDDKRSAEMKAHLENSGFHSHKRISALTPATANVILLEQECKRFSFSDVAILCSHMKAIHTALHDTSSVAKESLFALILEDDVRFQFNIDFDALLASAPLNFGVLQLMASYSDQITELWRSYDEDKSLWTFRARNGTVWSAQAYLINKDKYRPYIDSAVTVDREGKLGFKIAHSYDYTKSNRLRTSKFKPIIASFCIFADMFVYSAVSPAFVLNAPIFNSGLVGLNSSVHQTHVAHHVRGFALLQQAQRDMHYGVTPLPSFASISVAPPYLNRVKKPELENQKNHLRKRKNDGFGEDIGIDWAAESGKRPIKHWGQGSHQIQ